MIRKTKKQTIIDNVYTQNGTKEMENIFGKAGIFPFPKPTGLLVQLIEICDLQDDDIVLDFFAGSCTTADAMFQYNVINNIKSRCVSVQLPEPCEYNSLAAKSGYINIADIGKVRICRASDKIKKEHPGCEGDLGFKVLKLDSSNIKSWDVNFDDLEQSLLDSIGNIKGNRSEEDVLYEILLKYGLDLTLPIETRMIESKKVFSIGLGALVICLDSHITLDVVEGIGKLKAELEPEVMRVVFKDNGFKDDVVKTNAIQILKRYDIEDVKSL